MIIYATYKTTVSKEALKQAKATWTPKVLRKKDGSIKPIPRRAS
jgi:hypothetical protein